MSLTTIIISYNTCELMRNCLNSLVAFPPSGDHHIMVVDNASTDDTVAMIRREFPQVTVIANASNVGYAAAINQALQTVTTGDVLILNSDIEVHEGTIDGLVEAMAAIPDAGMCAPRLVLPDGSPQPTWPHGFTLAAFIRQQLLPFRLTGGSGGAMHDPADAPAHAVKFLVGAALLVRREALAAVGLMDEDYWMYCEDADWELRFERAGWKLIYVPGATMLHHHGASSRLVRGEMIAVYNRASVRFFRLHYGGGAAVVARVVGLAGTILRLFGITLATVLTLGLVPRLVNRTAVCARTLWYQIQPR